MHIYLTLNTEDLIMLPFIDEIEFPELSGDAFDDEVGAIEEMFGALEEMREEGLEELENLNTELANLASLANLAE